uniref:Uncharacterized protein n=1 Tax=Parascaris equorum TaxID=6256 RepID=A0A914R0Z6_PAREQ
RSISYSVESNNLFHHRYSIDSLLVCDHRVACPPLQGNVLTLSIPNFRQGDRYS